MSGRRSHVRFAVVRPPEGVLRVMRDVVVQGAGNQEVILISREPGLRGEAVILEFPADQVTARLHGRVVDSQPIVVGDAVRHRLRLEAIRTGSHDSDPAHLPQQDPARP